MSISGFYSLIENEKEAIEKSVKSAQINTLENTAVTAVETLMQGALKAILMGIAGSSFYAVNPNNKLIIRDSNAWNTAWGLMTTHYWACYPSEHILWNKVQMYLDELIFMRKKVPTSALETEILLTEVFSAIHNLTTPVTPDHLLTCFIYIAQKTGNFNEPSILFYLLNKIGVRNIAYDFKSQSVVLLSFNNHGNNEELNESDKTHVLDLDKYPYPFIGKFKIAEYLPNPWYDTSKVYVDSGNQWSQISGNLHVFLPPGHIHEAIANAEIRQENSNGQYNAITPAEVLANYTAFTPYFPFGMQYELDYYDGHTFAKNSPSQKPLKKNDKQDLSIVEKTVTDIKVVVKQIMEDLEQNPNQIDTMGNKHNSADNHAVTLNEIKSIRLIEGDRGGVGGFAGDVQWLHFVPRMVSYNWATTPNRKIKDGAQLSSYQVILDCFEYTIPDGLHITLHYAEHLPDWQNIQTIHQYTSIMEVVLPEPPKSDLQPIAFADFAAKRASLPFTCA